MLTNVHQTFTTAVYMQCAITLMDPTVAYANKVSRVTDSLAKVSMISSVFLLWHYNLKKFKQGENE